MLYWTPRFYKGLRKKRVLPSVCQAITEGKSFFVRSPFVKEKLVPNNKEEGQESCDTPGLFLASRNDK